MKIRISEGEKRCAKKYENIFFEEEREKDISCYLYINLSVAKMRKKCVS